MFFALLTFLAAFSIEGIGTLVSVIGLSTLFGANPIIIVLAVALDAGKIVVVSLLYKHWKRLGVIMKTYGLIAAAVTMTITSAGAGGYLSGEFQKAIMGTQEGQVQVAALKEQIAKYEARKKQIDDKIAAIPDTTSARDRNRILGPFSAEQRELQKKIAAIDQQLPALQVKQIGVEAKAGPILYISKAFNIPVEEAVKWVILMIIIVFDPLAVYLIIAANFLWEQRAKKKIVTVGDTRRRNPPLMASRGTVIDDSKSKVIFPTPPDAEPVYRNYPDASQAKVYSRDDLIAMGASDAALIVAGYEPRGLSLPLEALPAVEDEPLTFDIAEPWQDTQPEEHVDDPSLLVAADAVESSAAVEDAALMERLQREYTDAVSQDPPALPPIEPAPPPPSAPPTLATETVEEAQARLSGMTLEQWRARQLAKLDALQAGVDALSRTVAQREQITLAALGLPVLRTEGKVDPRLQPNFDPLLHEVGHETGVFKTGVESPGT